MKKHPYAARFGIKAEVMRPFLDAKLFFLNNSPETSENIVIIDSSLMIY